MRGIVQVAAEPELGQVEVELALVQVGGVLRIKSETAAPRRGLVPHLATEVGLVVAAVGIMRGPAATGAAAAWAAAVTAWAVLDVEAAGWVAVAAEVVAAEDAVVAVAVAAVAADKRNFDEGN